MKRTGPMAFAASLALLAPAAGAQADCPTAADPIATDRPAFANSSSVVPTASLQLENGVGASQSAATTIWDLPETRARFAVAACTEFLVDLPDYTVADTRPGAHGWTSLAPTIKHQFGGLPDGLTLSGAIGAALGTGARQVAGRGPAPYAQLPWTFDLGGGWTANGMYGVTFHPGATVSAPDNLSTVFLDRTLGDSADVFFEYANDLQHGAPTLNRVSVGGSYRYAPTRQIDLKVGTGLNGAAPDWYFTVGYSLRFDQVF